MADESLAGKRALITGASRGIGRATALALAQAGCDVALAARGSDALQQVADEIAATGRKAVVISCDITDADQVQRMVAETRARGATPILLTLTVRNAWHDGRIDCPSDTYRSWIWRTARDEKVAFVDLSRISADRYQRIGPAAVKSQFGIDTVHTNPAGAEANAADVIAGLRALRGLDFRSKLSAAGRRIRADAGPQKSSACPAL